MNDCPVILVHGLFGWGPGELATPYWGMATQAPSPLQIFEANVGPISSFHDRACELIAQIKGTRVDYGEDHARQHGHARFGKDYTGHGFYPEWDARHPVHLIGHSAGGNTMRVTQHLLSTNFHGLDSNAKWIKSISAISAVLNGTPLVYMLGCDPQTGLLRPGSIGDFLGWVIKLAALFHARTPESAIQYDLDLAHWGYAFDGNRPYEEWKSLITSTNLFRGTDNLAYDLSMQGCHAVNAYAQTWPDTWYFGYATERTQKGPLSGQHYPSPRLPAILMPAAAYQGWYHFADAPPLPEWGSGQLVDELWWANDGCVPTISQYYPFVNPALAHPVHPERGIKTIQHFEPGKWYHEKIEDATGCRWDHLNIVYGVFSDEERVVKQQTFYAGLYSRLASLKHETASVAVSASRDTERHCPFCGAFVEADSTACAKCGAVKEIIGATTERFVLALVTLLVSLPTILLLVRFGIEDGLPAALLLTTWLFFAYRRLQKLRRRKKLWVRRK